MPVQTKVRERDPITKAGDELIEGILESLEESGFAELTEYQGVLIAARDHEHYRFSLNPEDPRIINFSSISNFEQEDEADEILSSIDTRQEESDFAFSLILVITNHLKI